MNSLTAEIFAVGKWNGMTFTASDLDEIAANFNELAAVHKVPLKFGHNNQQPMTDGQPALGWVTKVWREGNKLFATFEDVPEIVQKAFEKKLYRRVSVELDIGVQYKTQNFRYVLSGVALLGADIPAVNVLADLHTYLDGGARLAASRRAEFSAIVGDKEELTLEEDNMSDELKKQVELLSAQFSKLSADQAEIVKKNTQLETENKELKEQIEARDKETFSAKINMHRKSIIDKLESAVKAGTLLPAQRELAIKFMRINDDNAVMDVTDTQIDEYISINGKKVNMSKQGRHIEDDEHNDMGSDPGAEIHRKAIDLQSATPNMTFSAAKEKVMRDNPELAKAWLN